MNRIVLDGESLITPETIASELAAENKPLETEEFAQGRARLGLALNIASQQFDQGRSAAAVIDKMAAELHAVRAKVSPAVWHALVPIVQNHPVAEFFLQDPFTRWSFEKPRGYSGDAHLLDFIYGHANVEKDIAAATPLGRALYDYTRNASSSVAVRERRDLLAAHVDATAAASAGGAEVLTIAAGHLREADRSVALREGRIRRWIALDQDPLSVGSIARDFRDTPVEAIDGSVRGLLTGAYSLGQFDFVYAAGLYDYLSRKVAVKLTRSCLELVKPGGLFLFANFAEEIGVDGYMETFMNWALLLRSEADMWDIVNASVDRNQVDAKVHFGANRNIIYGLLRKRA